MGRQDGYLGIEKEQKESEEALYNRLSLQS